MLTSEIYNPALQNLLRLISRIRTEKELEELKQVLADFYAKKIDEGMDTLWNSGAIDDHTINSWTNEHMRTPYKV